MSSRRPVPGEWQFVMHVDDFGKRLRIRFFANVPIGSPGEPVESQPWTGIGHFSEALVRRVSENGGQQDGFILGGFAVVKMGEAGGEPRPAIHFCEQVRQLDPRQEIIGTFCPFLGGFRHGSGQGREMELAILQSGDVTEILKAT